MREMLDCGVLMVPAHAEWMRAWMDRHALDIARVRLHAVALDEGALFVASNGRATAYTGAQAAAQSLARLAMSLRRFDACLLPVTPASLGWTRTALSCARQELCTPLIGLARGLKAAAVEDLLTLGMRDFVRDPLCPEELRVRVDRVACGRRALSVGMSGSMSAGSIGHMSNMGAIGAGDAGGQDAFHADAGVLESLTVERMVLHEPSAHYVQHGAHVALKVPPSAGSATSPATAMSTFFHGETRPRVSRETIDTSLLAIQAAPRIHPDEPFRIAKSRVVDSFEQDYVRTALSRYAGNVARAARASSKHRRAFWALMRKHHIDAAPYRSRHDREDQSD
jgi:hypothetical protein